MKKILIMIGSENDRVFLGEGLEYLKQEDVGYEVVVGSTHREPVETGLAIHLYLESDQCGAAIAGAATATGLPGIMAGYLQNTNIPIFGVRFSKNPGPNIIEDATFNLSSMPSGVPLAYTGFNEKGFLHACMLAGRVIKSSL